MGVPQGSVLGPLLWIVLIDDRLQLPRLAGYRICCYADDTLLIVAGKTMNGLLRKAERATKKLVKWIESKDMKVAPDKTEAVLFTTSSAHRNCGVRPAITTKGRVVMLEDEIKYLGVVIDKALTFRAHVEHTKKKVEGVTNKLTRLMPNIGGPQHLRRKLLATVAESVAMYAAPIWHEAMRVAKWRNALLSVQRKIALRVIAAYRTVSLEAALVLAGTIPWDLLAKERAILYSQRNNWTVERVQQQRSRENEDERYEANNDGDDGEGNLVDGEEEGQEEERKEVTDPRERARLRKRVRKSEREMTLQGWQERWSTTTKGEWTRRFIPNLVRWTNRKHGELTYRLTQALTGHGAYNAYLHKMGILDSPACDHCEENEDTAVHTLFGCPRWWKEREGLEQRCGGNFEPGNVMECMLRSREEWDAIAGILTRIMKSKEEEEWRMEAEGTRRNARVRRRRRARERRPVAFLRD